MQECLISTAGLMLVSLFVAVVGLIDRGVVRWNILNKVSGFHEKLKQVGEQLGYFSPYLRICVFVQGLSVLGRKSM